MKTLPIQIDYWLSSPAIESMDAFEERGYLRLLLYAARQEDCGVPGDDAALAAISLLGRQWYKLSRDRTKRANNLTSGQKLRSCFFERDGRLYDEGLLRQWESQNHVKEMRRRAGQLGNQRRWGQNGNGSQKRVANRSQMRSQADELGIARPMAVVDDSVVDSVTARYGEFLQLWPADKRGVDLGAQVWITLVGSSEINEDNIGDVFDGLERWKSSELWRKDNGKYIPAIANPQATGWLQKRAWKDHPKAAGEDF